MSVDTTFSQRLVDLLRTASHIMVLTGAGISAESGVPTFRSVDGIWNKLKPEELASVQAFLQNPELVQEWYRHRRNLALSVEPNAGHYALAELESVARRFTLVTQNVDNLHQRAGSANVVELHGNIMRSYCFDCSREASPNELASFVDGSPAHCTCGGLIRPDVVWFGEMLPADAIGKAHSAAGDCDVCLSIGTSAVVYPAAAIPEQARLGGAYVAEINIEPSAISNRLDEVVIGPAGEVLPLLVEAILS